MKIKNILKTMLTSAIFLLLFTQNSYAEISDTETALIGAGGTLWLTTEFFKHDIGPSTPRWEEPLAVDTSVRNALKWNNANLKVAAKISDVFLYGGILGSVFGRLQCCSEQLRHT